MKAIAGATKTGGFAIWRVPNAPQGEFALGLELRAGALHVLKHFADRADAQAMLDRLEATHGNALEAAATAAPE
jgi:hypothetical protein